MTMLASERRPHEAHRRTSLGREARFDAAVRATTIGLFALSVLWVVFLWTRGGGIRDLGGWDTSLLSTGRMAGLIASLLLLVQVLMMARIPILERAWGQDRLVSLHRLIGFTSFNLMVAHIGLITYGYAAGRLDAVPGTAWDLTLDYHGMLLAVAGTACLVMVVLTSIRAARRRLRYESWHLLHLYAYLGAGLALPHQLWTGQEFLTSTASTVFWWGLWASALAAVILWRFVVPVARSLRHDLRVTSVVEEAAGVSTIYLRGRRLDALAIESGQFLTLRFLSGPGWTRAHPFSLSAAPDGRSLRITVKDLGDASHDLRKLRPGTRVLFEGPYGRLSARSRTARRVLLIGAGVGVTPLRSLAEGLDYAPGEAILIRRCSGQPLFAEEFEVLSRERGLRVITVPGSRRTADSWLGAGAGYSASDRDVLRAWVPDVTERDVYLCGPGAWTAAVAATLRGLGLPEERLHIEEFAW